MNEPHELLTDSMVRLNQLFDRYPGVDIEALFDAWVLGFSSAVAGLQPDSPAASYEELSKLAKSLLKRS
jgi:hypothetical protein